MVVKFSVYSVEKGSFLMGVEFGFFAEKVCVLEFITWIFSSLSFDMILKVLSCADSAYASSLISDGAH